MRFNKQELMTVASFPSNKFEKEGILHITEKQDGFFRRTEGGSSDEQRFKIEKLRRRKTINCIGGTSKVNFARWCRLRGNLLFYLKDVDQFSAPSGVIVLENCRPVIRNNKPDIDGYSFFLDFGDGLSQRITANSETERTEWFEAIQMASFFQLNKQLAAVQMQIEKKLGSAKPQSVIDVNNQSVTDEIDIKEFPICESAISCDNLLCDGHGRPPNPFVVVQIQRQGWSSYGRTEVIERCSNPQFLCTICFWSSHGLSPSSIIRFNVYDVREKISRTTVPIGYAEITLGVIQDTTRLRIPLRSVHSNPGFITIASWAPEHDKRSPRSPAKVTVEQQNLGHRRSQSLPPKFGIKLFVPFQGNLPLIFANPSMHTYRLHSGLGGDISVQEIMMESRLCYLIPQQLLSIWILREKELLQEISGMGELGGEWRNKQMDLLDKHLKLLKDYSQAKQNLQQYNSVIGNYFKKSSNKTDESLEFVPTNLHLQRMWAHNDTLKRSGVIDIITVGAFTRHFGKSKTGGLIKLLQQAKHSPSKVEADGCKVQAANDAVQAIKQLRREIVEIMSQLLCLAKSKNPMGMLPLCNEMVNKTRTLLNLWEPNLVEETFEFIEQHRILDEPDNSLMPLSPFKKITQQLGALDLKSPELEDFATPLRAPPDLWPKIKPSTNITPTKSFSLPKKSPSSTDINTISTIQNNVHMYNSEVLSRECDVKGCSTMVTPTEITTICDEEEHGKCDDDGLRFNETHFDVNGEISSNSNSLIAIEGNCPLESSLDSGNYSRRMSRSKCEEENINDESCINELTNSKREILNNVYDLDETGLAPINCSIILGHNGAFLDTKAMSSSPSANYYRPTEEPEPLDLTQLNIEASVMCLVSKVKFLCGRCGSPAVRLRQPKTSTKRGFSNAPSDVVTNQPIKSSHSSIEQSERNYTLQPNIFTSTENVIPLKNNEIPTLSTPKSSNINGKDLNLALTQAVGEVTRRVKKGNKFTDGLDLSLTTDWASELRPSMRKLRQAMDGLLKTARLMHSVQRLQQDMREISTNLAVMYRRDVCFSQALTALISGLMAKLWGTVITENYLLILTNLGPLAYFEGLLSLYGNEIDMWGDMCVAVEDLSAMNFTLIRSNIQRESQTVPVPRVVGSRHSLNVLIPVPENVYCLMPNKETISFKITPVFFNIGINERATISETLGYAREQHRSNWDNFDRLKQYYIRFKKLSFGNQNSSCKSEQAICTQTISDYLNALEEQLRTNISKNVRILHLAEDICRSMQGLRFTSCKSAKDRTGMAVTLEQCRILQQEFHLPTNNVQNVLNTLRSEGTRIDNVVKNIGKRKFAFNLPQVLSLPSVYRPPAGSYGKAQT